ncbi:MAG TPA: pyruvate kinase [Saprospiraceae bacterium]|nr:pyruvate kinase [Saprospiraceae bacterium]
MGININEEQNTKIVATIGPASSSYDTLIDLVKVGTDVFRLNFSHGSHDDHMDVIERIRKINERHNTFVGILADLQGPKLRVGKISNNAMALKKGEEITFVNKPVLGTHDAVYMSYTQFAKDVKQGEKVLIDDGKIVLEVIDTNKKDQVRLRVLFGGILSSNKGVNLPDTKISLPSLTEKDLVDLEFVLSVPEINWIALSFVRSAKDIKDLKKIIKKSKHSAKVIAKIEKPEAVSNIDAIIDASDAIMIARGDLGVEVPLEQVPVLQKKMIAKCIRNTKPVIVATQMMESMITSPSPSRAEATDVANAVMQGTDAVMLSGETSIGKHPVRVVEAMNSIINEAEKHMDVEDQTPDPDAKSPTFLSDAVCYNAAKIAREVGAKAIVGMTTSGYTAFKVSSNRPPCKIFIFSDRKHNLATLSLVWGVRCMIYEKFTTTDETIADTVKILKERNYVSKGDVMVNTGSMPIKKRYRTNMLKVTLVE